MMVQTLDPPESGEALDQTIGVGAVNSWSGGLSTSLDSEKLCSNS